MSKPLTETYLRGFLLVGIVLFAAVLIAYFSAEEEHPVLQELHPLTGFAAAGLTDDSGAVVGHKVVDDPSFETRIIAIERTPNVLKVRFSHDAATSQPVWIEGDVTSTFSVAGNALPNDVVTLVVLLEDGRVPPFRLHVGPTSEIFEFGEGGTFVSTSAPAAEAPETPTPPSSFGTTDFSTFDVVSNCAPGPVGINTSTTLTNNISTNRSCITINSNNLVLDCAGFSIFYDGDGTDDRFGVSSNDTRNITVKNCFIIDIKIGRAHV